MPTYENEETMISTLQHLHMSDLLQHDEDAIDPDGLNDIDVSRMVRNGTANNDYIIGGNPEFQKNTTITDRIRRHFKLQRQREGNVREGTPNEIYSG